MTAQRRATIWLGLAIALANLIPGATSVARGADLARYVSSDFCGAIVVHPDRIGKSTLATALKAGLPKDMTLGDPSQAAIAALGMGWGLSQKNPPPGMDIAKLAKLLEGKTIVRIVVLIDPLPTVGVPAGAGVIVQFGDDIDGDGILSAVSSDWQAAESQGVKYKKLKNPEAGQARLCRAAPDARTLIAGLEVSVVKMLAKDQGSQPLLKQLQHTNFNNDIMLEYLAEPIWAAAAKGSAAEKTIGSMGGPDAAKLAKEIKSVSVKLNFSGKTLFHAEAVTDTPDTATMYAAAARKAVAEAKPKFEDLKKQPPPPMVPPPAIAAISKLGDEVFEGLTVKNDGPRLVVDLAMPASLPDVMKLAGQIGAQMAKQMIPPPAKPAP